MSLDNGDPVVKTDHPKAEDGDVLRSQALGADVKDLPEGYYSSIRLVGTFAAIGLSQLGTYWAFSGGASAIPIINKDIGPSNNSSLFSIVWTVCQCISILLFGRLSDRFGRRGLAIGANVLGIVGGIVACTATRMDVLIGANVLLGMASGPPASAVLLTGELAPNKAKFLAVVTVVVPLGIATGFGPYLSQRLAVTANWRWIFYIYITFMVPATLFFYFFYFPPSFTQLHGKKVNTWDEVKKIDFIGVFLLVAGLTLFLLGVSFGGQAFPWTSPTTLGLLISGGITLVVFVLYEIYGGTERPIIPMHFFLDLTGFTPIVVISAVSGCLYVALSIIWPSEVIYVFGTGSTDWERTAWLSSCVGLGAWGGILIFGPFFHIIKHIRWQLIVGCVWMTAFTGALASVNREHLGQSAAFALLTMIPAGWAEIVTMVMVQFVASDIDLGAAYSVVSAMRTIIGSIFTAIFVAEVTNKLPEKLTSLVVPAVIDAGLPSSSVSALLTAVGAGSQDALLAVPGMSQEILSITNAKVSDAYAAAYAYPAYTAVALGVTSIVAAYFIRDFDHCLSDHVSRQIYHKSETKKDILQESQNSLGEETQVHEGTKTSNPDPEKTVEA